MNPCLKHSQKKGCQEEHDVKEDGKTQDVGETSRRWHKRHRLGEVVQVAPKDQSREQTVRPQVGSVPEVCGCHRRVFKVRAMEGHFPL